MNAYTLQEAAELLRKSLVARQTPGIIAVGIHERDERIVVHAEGQASNYLLQQEQENGYFGWAVRVVRSG